MHQTRAGRSFVELVMEHSIDSSRAEGGSIGSISPDDPTYPKAIRQTLARLNPGEVGAPVAIEGGFAVLKLERKTEAQDVPFDDVKESLAEQVRRQAERILMERLARTLLDEADLVIRDPALRASWESHKDAIAR